MKRALLTGAAGFIGANLARRLVSEGLDVHVLLRPDRDSRRLDGLGGDVRRHAVDIVDEQRIREIVGRIRPDWVFHLAAYGGSSSQDDVQRIIRTNVNGTVNLLQACLRTGFEAFINTGSSSEYGFQDHPANETEALEPNSVYAVSKAAATLFCRRMAQERKAKIVTLRLYSVYGPYEDPIRFIPTLIRRGLKGELPPLVNPAVARDFVYVGDVVDAYLAAATHQGKDIGAVYNVGTGVQTSIKQAVELARTVLSIKASPKWGTMPDRRWDTSAWVADIRKIRKELCWKPVNFETGFRATVQWFLRRETDSGSARIAGRRVRLRIPMA